MDAEGFHDDAPPEADGMGFVSDDVETAGNGSPFALEDLPGGLGGCGELVVRCGAGAAFGTEIGDFVLGEGAQQSEIVTGGSEDTMLTVRVPAGDAFLEFGRTIELDFLGALNDPVL